MCALVTGVQTCTLPICLALVHVATDLADEEDHRRRILEGDMDADAGAGRARPARHEADAGPAGQLAIRIGHPRCATFLAGEVIGELRRVEEGVEHGEVALTGPAADAAEAFGDESIDQDAAAVGQGARADVDLIREGMPPPARA